MAEGRCQTWRFSHSWRFTFLKHSQPAHVFRISVRLLYQFISEVHQFDQQFHRSYHQQHAWSEYTVFELNYMWYFVVFEEISGGWEENLFASPDNRIKCRRTALIDRSSVLSMLVFVCTCYLIFVGCDKSGKVHFLFSWEGEGEFASIAVFAFKWSFNRPAGTLWL